MHFKLLTSEEDLREFAAIGNAAYKVETPFQYFTKGSTLGFFKGGKMVGGAAIITEGPFRSVEIIPADQRASSGIMSIPPQHIVEINAVWLKPEVTSVYDVIGFWYRIVKEVRKTKRPWMLVPYNQAIGGLDRMYKPLGLKTLFSGGGNGGGLSTHRNIRIGICHVSSLYTTFALQAARRFAKAVLMRRPARGAYHAKAGADTVRSE